MTRLTALLLMVVLTSCARHDIEGIEKECARIEELICGIEKLPEIEEALKSEGFNYSINAGHLSAVKHIPAKGVSLVAVSIVLTANIGPDGSNAGCIVGPLATGP